MPSQFAYVERSVLTWARRAANLEPLAAARKINVPDGRVEEWENGSRRPTVPELRRATVVYRRSLGVFFLPEPPAEFDTLRDFRRVGADQDNPWSAALHGEYRRAHQQREAILDVLEIDGANPVGSWRIQNLPRDDSAIAAAARARLLEVAPLPFPRASSRVEYRHLNFWISALEEAGVLVMATAGGGVSTEEMRAFSLYFDDVPVIVLNGSDYPRPRTFSLVHEYVHLLLHTAGLCDTKTDMRAITANRRLEARCNAIAAEVLMPTADVLRQPLVADHRPGGPWTLDDLIIAARPFGVSVDSFFRRLAMLGLASMEAYQRFHDDGREADLPARKGKPTFYNTKVRNLGKGYVRRVAEAYRRTIIDTTTATTYLDVKVNQIPELSRLAQLNNSRGA